MLLASLPPKTMVMPWPELRRAMFRSVFLTQATSMVISVVSVASVTTEGPADTWNLGYHLWLCPCLRDVPPNVPCQIKRPLLPPRTVWCPAWTMVEGHVLVLGPAAAVLCVDIHGSYCSQGSYRVPEYGSTPEAILVFQGQAATWAIQIRVANAASQGHSKIGAWTLVNSHAWIHVPVAARVCFDLHDFFYH